MKAFAVILTVLALASYALAGCSSTAATTCRNNLDTCATFTTKEPTCECSIAFRTCMLNAQCCSTTNTSDECGQGCQSNCGSPTCVWPPALSDSCALAGACIAQPCSGSPCQCEVKLRQCLLAYGCSYNSALSANCTSRCASRNPAPDCSAKSSTTVPPPPAGCVPQAGYVPSGDCSCRDDIRSVATSATCATATWSVTGNLNVNGVINLQYDTLAVSGDATIATGGGELAFQFDADSDAGKVTVGGSMTVNGRVSIVLNNNAIGAKLVTLVTAQSVSVPTPTSLVSPFPPTGFCYVYRNYVTSATSIAFNYSLTPDTAGNCTSQPPPTTTGPTTTGVATRPPSLVYVPPTSATTLNVFAAIALVAVAFFIKNF